MRSVKLTREEIIIARWIGKRRRRSHKNSESTRELRSNLLNNDIASVEGEMATAKLLNKYWEPCSVYLGKVPDIRPNIQVRTIFHPSHSLIFQHRDSIEDTFILVYNAAPAFMVIGSISGREAKNPVWYRPLLADGRPPAWYVPQSKLIPIEKFDAI